MTRPNARIAGLTLVLALTSSICLAATEKTQTLAGGEPPMRLSLESFNKLIKANMALSTAARDANLERALAMNGDPDTIRRWIKQVEDDEKAAETLKPSGLTPREYMRTYIAVLQAYAVSGLQKEGKAVPEKLMEQVPAENIAFVNQHAAEIESWGRKSGSAAVKPNTMEDVYVEQTPSPDDPKTAKAGTETTGSAPAAKPAAAKTSKTSAKDEPKPAAKSGTDKP